MKATGNVLVPELGSRFMDGDYITNQEKKNGAKHGPLIIYNESRILINPNL